jgi:lipopolysaccharide transport system permease protein
MTSNTTTIQSNETELPSPEQAFEWPRQAMREQNWGDAAKRWAVLRTSYPNHPAPWFQGIATHLEAGELEQAEALLTHAQQQFSEHPHSVIDIATLSMRQKQWDKAEPYLQQARDKFPNHLQTWLKSAECSEGQKNLKQADLFYQKACQCSPELPIPYIQYAQFAMRTEQWEQALEHWKTLRENFPNISTGYHRAAEAAHKLNQPKEARKLILAQQYGSDIFEDNKHKQNQPEQTAKINNPHTNIKQLLELVWTKANFNLQSEVHRNYLSYAWWVLEPLLHMVIYYVVFGLLLNRGGENYPVFLLTGLIPWMWFTKAISSSSNSILAGQNIMMQVAVHSIYFPLVMLLQTTIKQLPVFILLIGFVWVQGYPPEAHWWALIPVLIVQAILTIAFACFVAAIIPFIRDLSYLVPTGLTFLMFLSGIFYDYKSISADWQDLFLLNPMAFLLKCYREIFIDGIMPDQTTLAWWGLGSTISCLLIIFVYQRLRYVYPRIVME